jgi:hypothetical protein
METTTQKDIDEVLPEALHPDLSDDEFRLCGQTVKIKVLKVGYSLKLSKLLSPFLTEVFKEIQYAIEFQKQGATLRLGTGEFNTDLLFEILLSSSVDIASKVLENAELLPKIILLICENDGKTVTLEQIENQGDQLGDLHIGDMVLVVKRMLEKNQEVQKPVIDFFTRMLKNENAAQDASNSPPVATDQSGSTNSLNSSQTLTAGSPTTF